MHFAQWFVFVTGVVGWLIATRHQPAARLKPQWAAALWLALAWL